MFRKSLAAMAVILSFISFAGAADAPKDLAKPTNKPESWRFEEHEMAKGKMTSDGDAILFDITTTDGTDWHVQAFQTNLDLKDGKDYVVEFKAKASADRPITLNAGIDQDDWHSIGLAENVELTKDWKDFKFEFKADQTLANKNRIGFVLGTDKGKVWVKDLKVTGK